MDYLTNTLLVYTGILKILSGSNIIYLVDKWLSCYCIDNERGYTPCLFNVTRNLPVTFGLCSPYVTRNIKGMLSGT